MLAVFVLIYPAYPGVKLFYSLLNKVKVTLQLQLVGVFECSCPILNWLPPVVIFNSLKSEFLNQIDFMIGSITKMRLAV
jgi:hypothetical protein